MILVDARRKREREGLDNSVTGHVTVTGRKLGDFMTGSPAPDPVHPIVPAQQDRRLVGPPDAKGSETPLASHRVAVSTRVVLTADEIVSKLEKAALAQMDLRLSRSMRYVRRATDYVCAVCGRSYRKYDSAKHHFIRRHRTLVLSDESMSLM